MLPRTLFVAALATLCIYKVYGAIPFAVNHTELRRTHPARATNTGLNVWERRRARDTRIHLTTPIRRTSSPLGPFWANHSLVGQEVHCSDDAKRCLAINRLLHEPSGICYELGDTRPCGSDGGRLILDVESFRRGQLRSRCSEPSSCEAYNMAYDGKCYTYLDVQRTLCVGEKEIIVHPFGGVECQISRHLRDIMQVIRQPKSPGRCAVPNLQNNDIGHFLVECSIAENACLQNWTLPFRGTCHAPLSNTPCPEGQWLVLDEVGAENGRLSAKCVSSRPCGPDAQLLRADGSCHNNTELFEKLCNGYYIMPLPTGDYICTAVNEKYIIHVLRKENGFCEVKILPEFPPPPGVVWVKTMNCVLNDKNICQPEVASPKPKPELFAED